MNFINRTSLVLLPLVAHLTLACGEQAPDSDPSIADGSSANEATLAARLARLDQDLALGAEGDQVQAVYDYLLATGYFPSAELQSSHPDWRPAVAELPDSPAVYDDRMEAAVSIFQSNFGLVQTGVVDEATRHMLQQPRCSEPDNVLELGHDDKFSQVLPPWGKSSFTYKRTNTDSNLTGEQLDASIAHALSTWSAQTSITLTQEDSGPVDITIEFAHIDGAGGFAGRAVPHPTEEGVLITMDHDESWVLADPAPAGTLDFERIVLHELGHALALNHSAISGATMRPEVPTRRSITLDDKVGISSLYETWQQLPSTASDIGVGNDGTAWIIGTTPVNGGFNIKKWSTSGWQDANGGAVRIAVAPNGVPWAINSLGQIFQRASSAPGTVTWNLMPGCGSDIGIGANGTVWSLGCTAVNGGFNIQKWNGSGWSSADGGATRIAVGPTGIPWAVNSVGQILRRKSSASGTVGWDLLPGNGCAKDIGLNESNYAWTVSCTAVNGGFTIQLWNEQTAGNTIPGEARWITLPGGATTMTVGKNAQPWFLNNLGQIFTSSK